jgi:hypothetical protein
MNCIKISQITHTQRHPRQIFEGEGNKSVVKIINL